MPVYQSLMADGDWSLRLKPETPMSIREAMSTPFAHVVVMPAPIDPSHFSDADILSNARYTGVALRPGPGLEVSGRGLSWWLGDDNGTGSSVVTPLTINTNSYNAAVTSILNAGVTQPLVLSGSSTGGFGANHNAEYNWLTKRQILDSVVRDFWNVEWKVNNDFTVSVSTAANLYTGSKAVITPKTTGYEDGRYGISGVARNNIDYEDFANQVYALSSDGVGDATSLVAANTFYDGRGFIVYRQRFVDTPESAAGSRTVYAGNLASQAAAARYDYNLQTSRYDVSGKIQMGGYVSVYDPLNGFIKRNTTTGAIDYSLPTRWRGEVIYPIDVRVVGMRWPVEEGMGVLWRNRNASGVSYIDLTPYIEMESGSASIEIGGLERPIEAQNYASSNNLQQVKFNRWETYTPTLTNCSIGNGYISGRYRRDGTTLHIAIHMGVRSTTIITGTITMSLPPVGGGSFMTTPSDADQQNINLFWYDASTTLVYDGAGIILGGASTFTPWGSVGGANLTFLGTGLANGDDIHMQGTIEVNP